MGERKIHGTIKSGITVDSYKGSYTVTPSTESQTLPTAFTHLSNDILVNPIPYSEEVNETGGLTIKIG